MSRRIATACLAFLGCASSPSISDRPTVPSTPAPSGPATVVVFVRHAEKAQDGTSDPPLTGAGEERARCLADVLETFAPTQLWATQFVRTQSTLAPLAEKTGRTVDVFPAADTSEWEARIQSVAPGSHVVAAGHSNTIPGLVTALGGDPGPVDAQGNIDHDEYDRIVFVVLDATGTHVATVVHRYCVVAPSDSATERAL